MTAVSSLSDNAAKNRKKCCSNEEKTSQNGHHDHEGHNHNHTDKGVLALFIPSILSLLLLFSALFFDHFLHFDWFTGWIRRSWYLLAYLPVGFPVIKEAIENVRKGDVFSEFFLMSLATIGAFSIGEYPEGVAVMLFYAIGEVFQTLAVQRAQYNIKVLLDQRPDEVTILVDNQMIRRKAQTVTIDTIIHLKPGEKLGLDGVLLTERASFNTAALTGESKPTTKIEGEVVLAGMINLNQVAEVKVTELYSDSKLSKILELVQHATTQKSPTELFIRKFAKVYTPIVVLLALAICIIPFLFTSDYVFRDWLYRALVFLVISCPCALVISIPLGYFGGIGAASRNGILFKGSNYLDTLASIDNVVMDKTGTLTEGVFKVQEVNFNPSFDQTKILAMVNILESQSTHPVATAIHEYVGPIDLSIKLKDIKEIAGHGLTATIDGKKLLVGNFKLMTKFNIHHTVNLDEIIYTVIAVAYDNQFIGYLTVADSIKPDAQKAIKQLNELGLNLTMLSGDKSSVVHYVAKELGITNAFGECLPEDKVRKVLELKAKNQSVAFVGDGVNDAPVVALSDVGIAMGGLGSDATIETADVVIQDDLPSKIPMAVRIAKQTKKIVWQNITLAFVTKGVVLILGAGGIATMWEAVFADVGVALLAILNAVRIQGMKF